MDQPEEPASGAGESVGDAALKRIRRPRYSGKNPRKFSEKYKEHRGDADTLAKVLASGKTPAGTHRPIMVDEVLECLAPAPGETGVDCTLGHGGHAAALLASLRPGGRLLGLDQDSIELPRTEQRMRAAGAEESEFWVRRSNFAGLARVLAELGWSGADIVLADLGVSSMQLDDPSRGFTFKTNGPLDMRMNPAKSVSAADLLRHTSSTELAGILRDGGDEPHAVKLAGVIAGRAWGGTHALASAIRSCVPERDADASIRRVFQAIRIAVNEEFSVLDSLLRTLPPCLNPGGRVAILTFHSGEDRRVKQAFRAGLQSGLYSAISEEVLRPSAEEQRANPRSAPAKLRWARK